MKHIRFAFLLVVTFVFTAVTTTAQISSKEVDKLVKHAMEEFNVAGVSVAIVKDGKIIHEKGYGVKSVEAKGKVDEHTQFLIASNSKAFTSAALAILVDDGLLSWTDKVVDIIPEFTMYNPYVTANFNIEDLLSHRSGLGIGAGDLMWFPDGNNFTMDDILSCYQYFEPKYSFRTTFAYNNLLFMIAGEVVERVSGKTWEEFITEEIFIPLNMDNSFSSISEISDIHNLAAPHATIDNELVMLSHYDKLDVGSAAGIYSSVDDISKWMLVQLNEGKYGDSLENELFSASVQREMWKIHTTFNSRRSTRYNSNFAGYGLGWGLSDINGNMNVSHTGGMPGMLSKTVLVPDLGLGVVVLTNTTDGGAGVFSAVSNTIVESYMGIEDNDWVSKYGDYFKKREKRGDSTMNQAWEIVANANDDNININDYIGVYKDNWFGKTEVYLDEDQLYFKSYRSPKLTGRMYYYNATTYVIKWNYNDMNADAFAIFSLDEDGKAQNIKLKGISPNIDFSFDFQDLDLQRVK